MAEKFVLRVSEEQYDAVSAYAEERGIKISEAADKLISTAVSRLAALAKYGKKQAKTARTKAKEANGKAPKKRTKKKKEKPVEEESTPVEVSSTEE